MYEQIPPTMPSDLGYNPNKSFMNPENNFGSTILGIINTDNELKRTENFLRGKIVDEDGNIIYQGEALMNDLGINNILGILSAVVSKTTIMSNLDKKEIPMHMEFLSDTLIKDLMVHRIDYKIKQSIDRDKIFHNVVFQAHMALKRAYTEGERRFMKGSMQEIRTTVEQQNKPGLLSKLNPWAKR